MDQPHEESLRRFHASLNVTDLERSVAFYRVLLGSDPAKQRPDYAKFELDDPPLVLSLIPGRPAASGHLNHVGLRVRNAAELVEIQTRLEAAGIHTTREEGVACCYALQTKFWVNDPDRALWEIYVFHEDIPERGDGAPRKEAEADSPASPAPRIWRHRLGDPAPSRIPHEDNSLEEVRLDGTINQKESAAALTGLLPDAHRALRPGGEVWLHGLAGDRPLPSGALLSLPGPAAPVQCVPTAAEVMQAMLDAGFIGVRLEKLSSTAYFVAHGVPLRELLIAGTKSGYRPKSATHQAIYLGPLAQVTDDFGNVFHRGAATPLNVHDWQVLSRSSAASQFLLLSPDLRTGACCD